jgi:hypothetical protein
MSNTAKISNLRLTRRPGLVVDLRLNPSASYDSEKNRPLGIIRPIQQLFIPCKTSILRRSVRRRIEINFITKWSLRLYGEAALKTKCFRNHRILTVWRPLK